MAKICKIRWDKDNFSEVNMTTKKLRDIVDGVETTYDIGGSGGQWTETKIWENSDPDAAQNEIVFNSPKSLKGYEFFKCIYKETINDQNSHVSINDARELGDYDACVTGGISFNNIRRVVIQSDGQNENSISINNSITKTGKTDNTTNIILEIYGIKKEA